MWSAARLIAGMVLIPVPTVQIERIVRQRFSRSRKARIGGGVVPQVNVVAATGLCQRQAHPRVQMRQAECCAK
jgi:hypothetical protein